MPAVGAKKSSTFGSSGIFPVSVRPIAMSVAAWVQSKMEVSLAVFSASTDAMMWAKATATRS